jgi:hypothetical protein
VLAEQVHAPGRPGNRVGGAPEGGDETGAHRRLTSMD